MAQVALLAKKFWRQKNLNFVPRSMSLVLVTNPFDKNKQKQNIFYFKIKIKF